MYYLHLNVLGINTSTIIGTFEFQKKSEKNSLSTEQTKRIFKFGSALSRKAKKFTPFSCNYYRFNFYQ